MADGEVGLLWMPGAGADPAALDRIARAFPRPAEAMGEAWFMGERRTFPELINGLAGLTNTELSEILDQVVTGQCYFGAHEEWKAWHHYLLAERYPRIHEPYALLEVFISGLLAIYPGGIGDDALRRDLLTTVGRSLMEPECWPGGRMDPDRCLAEEISDPSYVSYWHGPSNKLSASIVFCLKYLETPAVAPWMRSVLQIADPLWRAQILAFAAKAHGILADGRPPPGDFEGTTVHGLYWSGTEVLVEAIEIPHLSWLPSQNNRAEALKVLQSVLTPETVQTWGESIKQAHADVWAALGDAPDRCLGFYSP